MARAPVRECGTGQLIEPLARHGDLPAAGSVQPANQVQQGGLARTRRAHDGNEVVFGDLQIEVVQNCDALLAALVALGDVLEREYRCHESSPFCVHRAILVERVTVLWKIPFDQPNNASSWPWAAGNTDTPCA